jgi:hypothetical protein
MYALMIKSMRELENHIKRHDIHTTAKKDAKDIKLCRNALKRIMNNDYYSLKTTAFFKKYPFSSRRKEVNGLITISGKWSKKKERAFAELRALQEQALKDDWKIFIRMFKKSQGWWC